MMRKGKWFWYRFIFRISLVTAVFVVFIMCLYTVTTQTHAEKSSPKPSIQIEKMELVVAKKEEIKQFQGQKRKVVYLTFDDGPGEYTNQLLDVLKKEDVLATFFLIGNSIKKNNPEILKRMADEGHYLGAHSMTHDYNLLYQNRQYVPEMLKVQKMIQDITGVESHLVRSPYGSYPGLVKDIRDAAVRKKLKTWDWSVDSMDWRLEGKPKAIVSSIKEQVDDDVEVILLHDRKTTVQALPDIIAYLRNQNYIFKVYNESEHFMINFWNDHRL